MAKILVTWSLPEGGVAYLVFGFTLFALAEKALQFLMRKRLYDWFFDRFSLISLPTQLLFWVGAIRRTSEYGLTSPRIYLLVCGGLMTLCVVLFLFRRAGRYMYVCLTAFAVFAAFAYGCLLGKNGFYYGPGEVGSNVSFWTPHYDGVTYPSSPGGVTTGVSNYKYEPDFGRGTSCDRAYPVRCLQN